jgi:hypothetical protein
MGFIAEFETLLKAISDVLTAGGQSSRFRFSSMRLLSSSMTG